MWHHRQMNDVQVRPMRPAEFGQARDLAVAAFDDPSIGSLLDALHASWAWIDDLSFVAERNGAIVGHVLYTHTILDAPEKLINVLLLSPVSVHPDVHHSGIGAAMIERSLAALDDRPEPAVFLEGDPAYYHRFGFVAAGEFGFRKPSLRIPDAAFQMRRLRAWQPELQGTLVYQDAFWLTDSVGLR